MPSMQEIAATLPKCAQTCIASAAKASTCAPTDLACFCKGLGTSPASACIKTTCTLQDTLFTTNATMTACGVKPGVNHIYVPILSVFLGIAAFFVLLRFLARFTVKMKLWWDDWFNFATMGCCIIYTAHAFHLQKGGWGTDIWAVRWDDLEYQLRGYYIQVLLYVLTRLTIRVSYLLFYLRIFKAMANKLILFTLAATLLISTPLVIVAFFQCRPVEYFWKKIHPDAHGTCINGGLYIWIGWSILLVNDLWILFLPIPLIYKLQLSLKKKIYASIMFLLGVVITATSVYKFSLIKEYTDKSNPTVSSLRMYIWAGVEIDMSVVCACLPCIPVLFKPCLGRLGLASSTKGSGAYPSASGYGASSRYAQISANKKDLASQTTTSKHDDPEDRIRMTTTIRQQLSDYNDSEANLAEPIELHTRSGKKQKHDWA